jgi:hypothetical protein
MTKRTTKSVENQDKFSITFEDDISIAIWRYDKSKSMTNPYEVEYKWKKGFDPWTQKKKTLSDVIKEKNKKGSEKI